ncbi:MAG: phosphoribosyltransferase family protein [Terrimicrobiaceae bacterium]|nr:phosphoribosyltransferase family protein [Terrimicrobiaceae bacterium]
MTPAERTENILREAHAILENDHFVSINGYHGAGWIDKDAINPRLPLVSELCSMLWDSAIDLQPEIICGPAEGGLIVSLWTASHAGLPGVFVEHEAAHGRELRGRFIFRRGYDRWVADRRVLIVDDIVNTGHSVRQTAQAVSAAGGGIVGIACYVDRGNVTAADLGGHPYRYLLQWKIPSWPEAETPPEILARPVNTRYSHGAEYLARQTST